MSIIGDCFGVGFAAIESVGGERVDYLLSDSVRIADVLAVPGSAVGVESDVAGQRHRSAVRRVEWSIRAALLTVDGELVEPVSGHRIERTVGGVTVVYQVQAQPGLACWDWVDGQRTHLVIRTIEVG